MVGVIIGLILSIMAKSEAIANVAIADLTICDDVWEDIHEEEVVATTWEDIHAEVSGGNAYVDTDYWDLDYAEGDYEDFDWIDVTIG